ncbi:MAG: DegT/DnrJ/EryC1/StrS family aminotransferase [Pirellulales bacterium]|nr:DegT/DnrJ/EryC1/StrS family aminotransferase [Pirellulales bacterium]
MASTNAKVVPFFNYPFVFTSHEAEHLSIIADVCRRGAFILQRDMEEFERNLAAYVGVKHVVAMANATDALHLAIRAAGIGPGDEVIFCTHTMVATASAIYFAGATPVPVECGPDHLIDPASVEAAVTPRTKAIMPTQLNGRTCDMDALQAVADKHDIIIIEDSAQALGSKYKGRCAGTFGASGCISFYPAKTLGCFGDGGCAMTNDDAMYEQLLLLRDHGRAPSGDVVLWGLNSRLDNLQAAVLNHKLKSYDREIARRREIAARYRRHLASLPSLRLPPGPEDDPDHFDIFQNYEIEAERRDELRDFLKQRGVGTLIQWGGKAVHQFAKLGFNQRLPFTEELFTRMIMLPMNTSLSDEDVDYVCACIEAFYGSSSIDYQKQHGT